MTITLAFSWETRNFSEERRSGPQESLFAQGGERIQHPQPPCIARVDVARLHRGDPFVRVDAYAADCSRRFVSATTWLTWLWTTSRTSRLVQSPPQQLSQALGPSKGELRMGSGTSKLFLAHALGGT